MEEKISNIHDNDVSRMLPAKISSLKWIPREALLIPPRVIWKILSKTSG
jgi:hypothetical protein